MSRLIQLLIGKELARTKGIDDPADQFRIGAIAAVMPNRMLGLVLANAIADREAPVIVDSTKPSQEIRPAETTTAPGPGEGVGTPARPDVKSKQ